MKKKTESSFRGAGRVSFLARKDRIKKMVDEGYPWTVIYEEYKKELNISYGQFTRYVNKYIRSKPHGAEEKPREQSSAEKLSNNPTVYDEAAEDPIFDEKKADEGDFF